MYILCISDIPSLTWMFCMFAPPRFPACTALEEPGHCTVMRQTPWAGHSQRVECLPPWAGTIPGVLHLFMFSGYYNWYIFSNDLQCMYIWLCVYIYIIIYIYTNLSYCLIFEDLRYLFPQKFRDHPWPWFADARSRLSLRQGFVFSFACKAANGCGKLEGHGRIMIRNHRGKKRRFRRERRRVHSSFSNIICLVPFFFILRYHDTIRHQS